MKRVLCLLSGAALVATSAMAQPPAAGPVGVALALQRQYAQAKANLTSGTDKLTDADYNFKPTPDIRAYGALFTHVADAHYQICAQAKGVPNPIQGTSLEQTKTTKADVVKALADSFAFCDDAFSTLTDETANQMMTGGRGGPQSKAAILMNIVAHDNEMYGISTVYQRLKGTVPPSTEQMMMRRGGPGGGGGAPAGDRGRGN
jgi:uncharacterized damage-inducible protein DinB